MMIKKNRKRSILLIIVLSLLISIFIIQQYKVETYIKNQKQEYGILKNRKRIKRKPFTIFLIERICFKKHYFTMTQFMYPYYENNQGSVDSIELYDSYILYSYYNINEIILPDAK